MRVRLAVAAALFSFSGLLPAGGASASCRQCSPFLKCIEADLGAVVCIEGPLTCSMLMPCLGGRNRLPDSGEEFTTFTLFDATAAVPSSLQPEAGMLSVGEESRRICRDHSATAGMVDAGLAYGGEYAVSFVTTAGDGFSLRRTLAGDRVHLEVREISGEHAGRLLASGTLGGSDQLTVPVRVEGRDRVLVLQAARLSAGESVPEVARLRRSLQAAGRAMPARGDRLFDVRAE